MAEDFGKAVEDGLKLSKRIYFGKDRAIAPPKPVPQMENSPASARLHLPASPMVYAVISNPGIVDNPDIPSYQPHVHGRCDPPALLPLQMNDVALKVDCWLDTAFVTLTGSWRVHCVMGNKTCRCRVAIPMGEQGSILGIEVGKLRKSYSFQQVAVEDKKDNQNEDEPENGEFIKPHIYTFMIPQVDGGTNLSIKVCWSQKLIYNCGNFCLNIPFAFPEYVIPAGKKISKREKIQLSINCGPETEVLCKSTSHPLKEQRRLAGKLGFLYEAEVLTWSTSDLNFSYSVSPGHMSGGVLLQSPSMLDSDQRDMFCLFLFPGPKLSQKVLRREVVFLVDISGSMKGKLLDDTKSSLSAALAKLDPKDKFNIIAFNKETILYSSNMELATQEAVEKAIQWIHINFIVGDGTNISLPLNQAVEMLSNVHDSVPMIFLITDGTVEDERQICDAMKSQLANQGSICPRIHSFGIGTFCNHYFLRTLSMFGRGHYDAAYHPDSIAIRMEAFFSRALSTVVANVAIENLDNLDELQVFPPRIPDLQGEIPLIVSGRYKGKFPDALRARGILADMSSFTEELKVHKEKDIPLDKVLVKDQIGLLTAEAWFSEKKELEEKIAKMSIRNGVSSEYTRMILLELEKGQKMSESVAVKEKLGESEPPKIIKLQHAGIGFGNLAATIENRIPGTEEERLPEAAEIFVKAASNCCSRLCGHCCCMCCIQLCERMNDQCAIALTQLCGALAFLGCFVCCDACCPGNNL